MTDVDDSDRSSLGIPVKWMWMPYAGLTLTLLSALIYSFVKFHRKNYRKYHGDEHEE